MVIVVNGCMHLSASPFCVDCKILYTSLLNSFHSCLLLAGGHLIRCQTTVFGTGWSFAQSNWALWFMFWPCSSSSRQVKYLCFALDILCPHTSFWLDVSFNLQIFLQTLLHLHTLLLSVS